MDRIGESILVHLLPPLSLSRECLHLHLILDVCSQRLYRSSERLYRWLLMLLYYC